MHRDPCKKKAALCGRRAGKSRWLAAWFYEGMVLRPGEANVYMTVTRAKAREVLWKNGLDRLKRAHGLPIELTHEENQLIVRHENGSTIWLLGVPDKGEIDKVRGGFYFRAAVDEAQAFPDWLEELVESALEPALMDLGGELALTGTPGAENAGYFFEVTNNERPGWACYHWTVLDNPYLQPQGREWYEQKREYLGEDNPTFLREYAGIWVNDPNALVYPFTRERNGWVPEESETPYGLPKSPNGYSFGLGIDLGWSENSTAFTLGARPRGSGKLYLLRSWYRSRVTPQKLAALIQQTREEVRTVVRESGEARSDGGLRVVVDEGALGQGWTKQMLDWGVATEAAQKSEKRAAQDWMRGIILSGHLKVYYSQCTPLVDEARKLPFDPETGKESDRFLKHNCDSALYLTRALIPRYDPKLDGPIPGSREWQEEQMQEHKKKTLKRLERERSGKVLK